MWRAATTPVDSGAPTKVDGESTAKRIAAADIATSVPSSNNST
jgi:hypothetical protein